MSFLTIVTTKACTNSAIRFLVPRGTLATTTTTGRRLFGTVQDPPLGGFHEPSNRVADKSPHPPPSSQNHHHLVAGAGAMTTTTSVEEHSLAPPPGSRAFVECDRNALIDLFHKYAVDCDVSGRYLDLEGLRKLLKAVGENLDQATLERLFATADINGDGTIELNVRKLVKMDECIRWMHLYPLVMSLTHRCLSVWTCMHQSLASILFSWFPFLFI